MLAAVLVLSPTRVVTLKLCVAGVIDEVILEGRYVHRPSGEFKRDKTFINGLPDYHLQLREHIKVRAR